MSTMRYLIIHPSWFYTPVKPVTSNVSPVHFSFRRKMTEMFEQLAHSVMLAILVISWLSAAIILPALGVFIYRLVRAW